MSLGEETQPALRAAEPPAPWFFGAWRESAARCLAGPALFHHPRSCQAKVNETFRGHFGKSAA
jgi:hypothetical protein